MRIVVTGGKGGTGKSTVATALAAELAKHHSVLLMDMDVDCPDDHLILGIERHKAKEVMQVVPELDRGKCTKCGRCSKVCKENAIAFVEGNYPIFVTDQCIGCKACMIACPANAIMEKQRQCGTIYTGKSTMDFVAGEIVPTQKEGSPIVSALKEFETGSGYDFVIVDTAAGTHCTVISAIKGADMALVVTEPTPLGAHDLGLILDLLKIVDVPGKIVLNRAGVGDRSPIDEVAAKKGFGFFGEVPYSKEIMRQYSNGEPVSHESIKAMARKLEAMV